MEVLTLTLVIISRKISKNKHTFAKSYVPYWSEQIFVITKVKNTVSWTYEVIILVILTDTKSLERFTEKNYKKQIKKSLELKK